MHFLTVVTAALGVLPAVTAHYVFDRVFVNGQARGGSFQHILENTRREKYMPTKFVESYGTTPLDNDFRCNQGAFSKMGKTQVLEVAAGSEMSFQLAYGARMEHPGPGQVYMSRAPGSVKNYDGSGDWFKIFQTGICRPVPNTLTDTAWCTWAQDRISVRIPPNTPNGEYLIRPEHIALHGAHGGHAEFYYSCALVRITNGGSGTPGPMVKIPGVYQPRDPALNFGIYHSGTTYPHQPGPNVWSGSGGSPPPSQPPPSSPPPSSGCSALYGQCGGQDWRGATCCSAGRCVRTNEWYSQCVN